MGEALENKVEIVKTLKNLTTQDISREKLFGVVFDLFQASVNNATPDQLDMCEDVLTQLIGLVEEAARIRIAERLADIESAPLRVVQCLAVEPIQVAQPILCRSPVLRDEDLLMVTRLCGPQHLEAIAERKYVSVAVTNELMRVGTVEVWERLAHNQGAELGERSVAFLANRARENRKIQLGLIERPNLPESVLTRLISEAGESVRQYLTRAGRQDLLAHLDRAKAVAQKRVLSTSSVLGFEFDAAYQDILRQEKLQKLTQFDLLLAARADQFPRLCSIFARIANLSLEDAVHWLSRREVDPAIVAFKALGLNSEVVEAMLKAGPWKRILPPEARLRALRVHSELKADLAKRLFDGRTSGFAPQRGTA